MSCNAKRFAATSCQRSCASSVEQVPSVMESPNATIAVAPEPAMGCTSIDFSQNVAVVVPTNGMPFSEAVWSPAPLSVKYDVT